MSRDRLWEQYGRCVDEYRFQVNLNWSRSQYFFGLNVALLAAGVGLLSTESAPAGVPMAIFTVGALSAIASILASTTQHDYYRSIRDRKRGLEERLGLGDLAIKTTRGMGGRAARFARVTTFQNLILAALCCADLIGLGTAITNAVQTDVAKVEVAVQLHVTAPPHTRLVPLVFSRDGTIVAARSARPSGIATVRLQPGRYVASVLGRRLCTATVDVTSAPLQGVPIRCR